MVFLSNPLKMKTQKYLEPSDAPKGTNFHVYGVGVDETMPRCIVKRPHGRGDWLFMHFHTPVEIMLDGNVSEHASGTLMIWEPGDAQYYGNPEQRWRHSWLHCHGLDVENMVLENRLGTGVAGILPETDAVNRIFNQIYDEITRPSSVEFRIVKNLFEIFVLELRRAIDSLEGPDGMPGRLLKVRHYIEQHYAEKVSLTDLAEFAGLSVSQFCSVYKKHTGSSAIDSLIRTRMRHAVYLLSNVNLSIAEVAAQCGYDDPFQFSKLFKKHIGKSPRECRAAL